MRILTNLFRARKTSRRRNYTPRILDLESRQLLSLTPLAQTIQGINADVTFKSFGGSEWPSGDTFNTSVGAKFEIDVTPKDALHPLAQVDYSTPNSLFGPDSWDAPIHSSLMDGFATNNTNRMQSMSHNVFLPNGTDMLDGFIDESVGTRTFSVAVSFVPSNGGLSPDPETFSFDYHALAPFAALNATFPTSVNFGPWQLDQQTNQLTPVNWGDPNMAASTADSAETYTFGFMPTTPMSFSVYGENNTDNPGSFSTVQFIRGVVQKDAVQADVSLNPLNTPLTRTPVSWFLPQSDTWMSDTYPNSAAAAFKMTVAPWDQDSRSAPSPSETFGDQPRILVSAQGDTNRFLYAVTEDDVFQTDILWTPEDGTPVVVTMQAWELNARFANKTAMTDPNWANSYGIRSNWVELANQVTYASENHSPSLIPNTTQNATMQIRAKINSANGGWTPGVYTIVTENNQQPTQSINLDPWTTGKVGNIPDAPPPPPVTTTTTTTSDPGVTGAIITTSSRGGSGYPLWANNDYYPDGVVPGLSNSTNGIPNGYWRPTPQGALIPIPPDAIAMMTATGTMFLWYDSWGAVPTELGYGYTAPLSPYATMGTSSPLYLGSFSANGSTGPWNVSVSWGDGSSTNLVMSTAGEIPVTNHTYWSAGDYAVNVSVTSSGSGLSSHKSFSVGVEDPNAPQVTRNITFSAPPDQYATIDVSKAFNLGSFSDTSESEEWFVRANWGDGSMTDWIYTSSKGVINPQLHTYQTLGDYIVEVEIIDGMTWEYAKKDFRVVVSPTASESSSSDALVTIASLTTQTNNAVYSLTAANGTFNTDQVLTLDVNQAYTFSQAALTDNPRGIMSVSYTVTSQDGTVVNVTPVDASGNPMSSIGQYDQNTTSGSARTNSMKFIIDPTMSGKTVTLTATIWYDDLSTDQASFRVAVRTYTPPAPEPEPTRPDTAHLYMTGDYGRGTYQLMSPDATYGDDEYDYMCVTSGGEFTFQAANFTPGVAISSIDFTVMNWDAWSNTPVHLSVKIGTTVTQTTGDTYTWIPSAEDSLLPWSPPGTAQVAKVKFLADSSWDYLNCVAVSSVIHYIDGSTDSVLFFITNV